MKSKSSRVTPIRVSKSFKVLAISLLLVVGAVTSLTLFMDRTLSPLAHLLLLTPAMVAGALCVLVARMRTRIASSAISASVRGASTMHQDSPADVGAESNLTAADLHYKKLGRIALAVFLMSSILLALCVVLYLRGDRYLDVPAFLLGSLALVAGLSAVAPRALLEPRYEPTPETEDSGWYMSMDGGITISPMAGEGGLPIKIP